MLKQNRWEKFLDSIKLSRRKFLKVSAATAGVAALTTLTGCGSKEDENYEIPENTRTEFTTGGDWKKNTCPRNCHDTCSIKTQVIDGKVIRIKGDNTNPYTDGNICVKNNLYVNYLYDPNRLLYPMKRVGAKGEGKFERISWDEAYDTIVEKTKAILEENGPNSIVPYNYSGTLGYIQNYSMNSRYFNKLGASALLGNICLATGSTAIPYTFGADKGVDPEQYANTSLYVSWGTNESATGVHQVKFIKQCKENGGKVVVVNSTPTPVSNFADLFVRPKGGTDSALALAVMNILFKEDLYDKEFVEKHTVGIEELKKQAENYPVEKAAEITGVPAETILEFARMYGQADSSIIRIGYGMQRRTNGGSMVRAITFLPVLTGMIGKDEKSGYVFFNDYTWAIDWNTIQASHLNTNPNPRSINMVDIGKALNGQLESTEKEPLKHIFVFNANPMTSTPNIELIRKGLEREDLFTVVADIFHTDTVNYADIVLPAATFFEYEDINQDYLAWYLRYNEPAVKPLGECKSNFEVFKELSKRMGFKDKELKMTEKEIIEETLKNASDIYGGVTYEELKKNHWQRLTPGVPFADKKFNTPSGKIEFYSEKLQEDTGMHPVVDNVAELESEEATPELFAKYPLKFMTLHTKNLINGQYSQMKHIQAVAGDALIFIHENDAASRGIVDGDMVTVKNDRGDCNLKAKVTAEKVLEGVVMSYISPWQSVVGGRNINSTTPDQLSDVGAGSTFHSNLVEVVKA